MQAGSMKVLVSMIWWPGSESQIKSANRLKTRLPTVRDRDPKNYQVGKPKNDQLEMGSPKWPVLEGYPQNDQFGEEGMVR